MITLPNKVGLLDFLRAQGWSMRVRDGVWIARTALGAQDDAALQVAIAAYNELPAIKAVKIAAIKLDGFARVQAVYPAITSFDALQLVSDIIQSVAPAARQLTADMTKAAAIWNAGKAAIAAVNAAATAADVAAVTPSWPA